MIVATKSSHNRYIKSRYENCAGASPEPTFSEGGNVNEEVLCV
jgi:hypothetical protein